MTNENDKSRVLVVSGLKETHNEVQSVVKTQDDFELIKYKKTPEKVSEAVQQNQPDILLVDTDSYKETILDQIDEVTINFPGVGVIVLLSAEEAAIANRVMLAGARAFLLHPIDSDELVDSLARVRELQERVVKAMASDVPERLGLEFGNRTIAVYSPRGGSGCTTVAVNLAIAYKKIVKDEVLLIDGKNFFGHVDLMLNVRSKNSIADLISHVMSLDESLIEDVVSEHVSGIQVLPSPDSIALAQSIKTEDLFEVILTLQEIYPHIIIDVGSAIDDNAVTLMDSAYKIVLVITPDLASLRDAQKFLQVCSTLNYPPDKVLIVINQSGIKGGVRNGEIQQALQSDILASIPYDNPDVIRSLNRGVPLMTSSPNGPAGKSIRNLARGMHKIDQASRKSEKAAAKRNAEIDTLSESSRRG
jgi:pilus assembly protein CpaE